MAWNWDLWKKQKKASTIMNSIDEQIDNIVIGINLMHNRDNILYNYNSQSIISKFNGMEYNSVEMWRQRNNISHLLIKRLVNNHNMNYRWITNNERPIFQDPGEFYNSKTISFELSKDISDDFKECCENIEYTKGTFSIGGATLTVILNDEKRLYIAEEKTSRYQDEDFSNFVRYMWRNITNPTPFKTNIYKFIDWNKNKFIFKYLNNKLYVNMTYNGNDIPRFPAFIIDRINIESLSEELAEEVKRQAVLAEELKRQAV